MNDGMNERELHDLLAGLPMTDIQPKPPGEFDWSLFASFPISEGLGTDAEATWLLDIHHRIDAALRAEGVGYSDGWGRGMGDLDVTCFVADPDTATRVIVAMLIPDELVAWLRVSASRKGSGIYTQYYPKAVDAALERETGT